MSARRPMPPRTLFGGGAGKELQLGRENQFQRSLSGSSSGSLSSGDGCALSDVSTPTSPPLTPVETTSIGCGIASAMECNLCLRQGAPLFCFACGFYMANGRVAKDCPRHPKVKFYTDFTMCPKCKQAQISELP